MKWKKANVMKSAAEETFHMLASSFEGLLWFHGFMHNCMYLGGCVSEARIEEWLIEESAMALNEKTSMYISA